MDKERLAAEPAMPSKESLERAKKLAGSHFHVDEDCYFCCYACPDCCNKNNDGKCNCGLEDKINKIATALDEARAEQREKLAQWMISRSLSTGHGDTIEDLLKELDWQLTKIREGLK